MTLHWATWTAIALMVVAVISVATGIALVIFFRPGNNDRMSNLKWLRWVGFGLIALGLLCFLASLGLLIWRLVEWWKKRGNPAKPVGDLVPTAGPYKSYNGIGGSDDGTVTLAPVPTNNIYGHYGYRSIRDDKKSDINWMERELILFEEGNVEPAGFTFRVPKQTGELWTADIKFELVANYYKLAGLKSQINTDLVIHGYINSTTEPLQLVEDPVKLQALV